MADHSTRTPARVQLHHPGDSDPDMDEALRRVRKSGKGRTQ
ncbi:hypothetical protein OOK13_40345 [Streptomyces sp. NBC_00378]|nr:MULTISPECIES: hypothetical protein [unclassified Streptomyces]MCX5112192.1 hypothetical protein [Streptomyces sp. NBC_00378]MCX5114613.1 hypothetical protein [Streptomyces sp. NBC_00378]